MRQNDARQIGSVFLDKANVRQDHIDAGIILTLRKRDPAIDHHPLTRILPAVAIQVNVHADFAETTKGDEYELFPPFFPAPAAPLLIHGLSFSFCAAPVGDAFASATSP